jgi:hypothetical protein
MFKCSKPADQPSGLQIPVHPMPTIPPDVANKVQKAIHTK